MYSSSSHLAAADTELPTTRPAPVPSGRTNWWVYLLTGCLAVFVVIPAAIAAFFVGYYQVNGLILPGVSVAGAEVGNMDRNQAAQVVNQSWNEGRALQLSDGTQSWQVPPSFFGLWVDPNATIEQAYQVGRGRDGIEQVFSAVQGARVDFSPIVTFDEGIARAQLQSWAAKVDLPAVDATIRLENGQPVVTPAQPGIQLDIQRTLAGIAADPYSALVSGKAWVFFNPITPRIMDLSVIEAQAKSLLATELKGTVYDPISDEHIEWKVPPETIAGWVRIDETESGYQAMLDKNGLVDYLTHLQDHVDLGPGRTVRSIMDPEATAQAMLDGEPAFTLAAHLPGTYTVGGGETLLAVGWKLGIPLWRMQQANPGVNKLTAGQTLVVPSFDDLLPLPVVLNKRIVVSITKQRMWVYEDGQQVREFIISTGIADSPTQPGVYQVQTHDLNAYAEKWDLYMPHWLGIYEAWPGFMNGIHGLPMLSSGVRLWKNVLGRPASYGCIILDLPQAEWLYNWAENGVVVEIQS